MAKFLFIKYLSLGLNAARSLILAAVLGPASYGFFGTLIVVQQYLSYAALGMREGLTVRLAQPAIARETAVEIQSSGLAWGAFAGLCVIASLFAIDRLVRPLATEWLWVGLIALLSIVNEILINISRDRGDLAKVAILELVYNAAPFACVLLFQHDLTVVAVLQSIALGLLISVLGYLSGLKELRRHHVRLDVIRRLILLGIPLAVASFFSASVTSIYVLVANAMHLGKAVGLIAFGNSICSIVLFGSNMVAWAVTSNSMRRLAADAADQGEARNRRLTVFFRCAVLASCLAIVLSHQALALAMPAYLGAERYALYFCLLQSFALLLYVELNFLAVRAKSMVIALAYGAVLGATLLAYLVFPDIGIVGLVTVGIVVSTIFGAACVVYCRGLGLVATGGVLSQFGYLAFPAVCAMITHAFGAPGSALVVLAFLTWALATAKRSLAVRPLV